MPSFSFNYKGGIWEESTIGGGVHKFLVFVINNKKEIPLSEALSMNLVERSGFSAYTTNCGVLKLFVYHKLPNRVNFMYSFFLLLGPTGTKYVIKPYDEDCARQGYCVEFEGRFLKTSEVKNVISKDTLTYKLTMQQGIPARQVLQKMITKETLLPKVVQSGALEGTRLIRKRAAALPLRLNEETKK